MPHREPLGPRQAGQPAARHRLGLEDVDVGRVLDERPDPFDRGADVHGPSDGPLAHRLRGTSTEHARQRRQAGRLPQALGEIASGVGHGRGGPDSVEQMQTFLPYADFERSARVLDAKRLGKQRVEVIQVVRALTVPGYAWAHHPAALMWKGLRGGAGALRDRVAARCGPTSASATRRPAPSRPTCAPRGSAPSAPGRPGRRGRAAAVAWRTRTCSSEPPLGAGPQGPRLLPPGSSPTCRTTCPTWWPVRSPAVVEAERRRAEDRRTPRRAGGRAGADRIEGEKARGQAQPGGQEGVGDAASQRGVERGLSRSAPQPPTLMGDGGCVGGDAGAGLRAGGRSSATGSGRGTCRAAWRGRSARPPTPGAACPGPAHTPPGGDVELVEAVVAGRVDRTGVAAGLAIGEGAPVEPLGARHGPGLSADQHPACRGLQDQVAGGDPVSPPGSPLWRVRTARTSTDARPALAHDLAAAGGERGRGDLDDPGAHPRALDLALLVDRDQLGRCRPAGRACGGFSTFRPSRTTWTRSLPSTATPCSSSSLGRPDARGATATSTAGWVATFRRTDDLAVGSGATPRPRRRRARGSGPGRPRRCRRRCRGDGWAGGCLGVARTWQ